MSGTEWVSKFTASETQTVVVSAADFSWYPFIAVVRDNGSGVDPTACVTANYYSASFSANAGESFYIIVDQDGTVPSMTFDVQVDCAASPTESACADGFDNDGDYQVDCADMDCDGSPSCDRGTCTPSGVLSCGDTFVFGDTGSISATNTMSSYTCWADRVATSPERAYTFNATTTGWVNFTVSNFGQYPMLFVLEDDGTGCSPNSCIAHDYYSTKFYAVAGRTYYLVADGWGGNPYTFYASLVCDPPAAETDCANNIDDDGDTGIDCADSDCDGTLACANGACVASETIDCTTWLKPGQTDGVGSTNMISTYACSPTLDLNNSEHAYQIGPMASTQKLVVTLSNESSYGLISIVEGVNGTCSPANCIAEQYYSVKFTAQKGKTYYAIVEPDVAPAITYDLSVVCGAPATEAGLCNDGVDNDGDITIDCADSDCASECGGCAAGGTLSNSTTLLPGSTAAAGATSNAITNYGCAPINDYLGNEYSYTYDATADGWVNFTLSDETTYATLAVLEDTGSCSPTSCAAFQYYSVVANVNAGKRYYVVVDTPGTETVDYKISVVPNPPSSEAGLCTDNIDNDGDFAIDCHDPDCGCP